VEEARLFLVLSLLVVFGWERDGLDEVLQTQQVLNTASEEPQNESVDNSIKRHCLPRSLQVLN
jgi:hypothetical protein